MRPTRRSRRWMRRAGRSSAITWCASSRSPGATSPRRRAWPGATAPSSTGSWSAIPLNPACSRPPERPGAHYPNDQGAGEREGADGIEASHDAIAVGQEAHDQRGAEVRDAPAQPAERKRRTALLLPAGLRDGDLEVQGHGARAEADEQHPKADGHGMVERRHQADGRPSRGRLCAETGKKGHQPSACQGEESGPESRCSEEKSTQRSAGNLAYVGRGVEASQLDAALPRQLARQRPGRRPERGPRQDQGELAEHQHPEPVGEHEPDAGYDDRPARTQHDAPSADAVGVGATGEGERHLSQDRGGEQRTDLGRQGVSRRPPFRPRSMRIAAALLALFLADAAGAERCSALSGERTVALVELYTSQGCSSCPPADRWLSGLGARGYVPQRVVPLSLHVDYWDYIGWKDPYAKGEFSARQRKLTQLQRSALVYTPQVLLQGRDFRRWGSGAFDEAVARINAQAAKARIALEIRSVGRQALEVEARAELLDRGQKDDVALYLATYENKLSNRVTAGENRGRTLAHDYVVLEWEGPFAFSRDARLLEQRVLPLLPRAVPANSGVVGFVQNRSTTEVLQALMLPACPA